MNLPFRLRNDKGLRDSWLSEPYRIVSLWDLLEFRASQYVKLSGLLGKLRVILDLQNEDEIISEVGTDLRSAIYSVLEDMREMELSCSVVYALQILVYISGQKHPTEHLGTLKDNISQLLNSLEIELRKELCLRVAPRRAASYQQEGTFLGKDIVNQFSDIGKDAEEAGNCFSLGRYTACVFHLMRIIERLVQEFALNVGAEVTHKGNPVEIKYAEWHEIEDAINAKVKDMPKGTRKSRCNAALTTLGAIRLGVRNEVMHPRGFYDEEDSIKLLNNVKSFVHEVVALPVS